jgi:hypothetical protein
VALISASLLASRAWLGKLGAQSAEHQERESVALISASLLASRAWLGKLGAQSAEHQERESVALISASLLASRAWLGKLGAQPAEHQRESAWLLSVASRGALHASMAREGCRRARRAPCLRTALHRFSAARSLRPSKSLDIGVASKTRISPPAVRAVRAYLGSWVKT